MAALALVLVACGEDGGGSGTTPQAGVVATMNPMLGSMMTPTAGSMAGTGTSGVGGATPQPMAGAGVAQMGAPTFTAIFDEIFTNGMTGNCMAGFCHGAGPSSMVNGNLQITYDDQAGAYNNLVNVVSTSEMCAGMTLVVPGNAAASMLVQKLGASPPCGMRMPVGPPLSETQVAQIAAWIDMGALDN
jgi:hypothetical protein